MDPPFTKLDILVCRNLLIYLTPDVQRKLIALFHYALKPGGFLFLGSSETVGADTGLFTPLSGRSRLYRRRESPPRAEPAALPAAVPPPSAEELAGDEAARSVDQPADARGAGAPAAVCPPRRAGRRQGGHPLRQRAARARTWSRRPARPTGTSSPWPARGCASSSRTPSRRATPEREPRHGHRRQDRGRRRDAGRGHHGPGPGAARGAAGAGADRLQGRADAP